jgi:hypothetical protein
MSLAAAMFTTAWTIDDEALPFRRQLLIRQSMATQQHTDDRGEDDDGKQQALTKAPTGGRDTDRGCRDNQRTAKRKSPERCGSCSRTRGSARQSIVALDAHLCPPQRRIVPQDKWKARYNLRLAIDYRDTRQLRFSIRPRRLPADGRQAGALRRHGKRMVKPQRACACANARKSLILQHGAKPIRSPRTVAKTNPDQDAADLANPEPRRFNRFAIGTVHNGASFMTCQVQQP